MATRRRIGVSAASTEAARRQLMQPVPCYERLLVTPDIAAPGSTLKVWKWAKTDKIQHFSDDEGGVDDPLAPLPDEPEVVEGDEEIEDDTNVTILTTIPNDGGIVTKTTSTVEPTPTPIIEEEQGQGQEQEQESLSKPPSPKPQLSMTMTDDVLVEVEEGEGVTDSLALGVSLKMGGDDDDDDAVMNETGDNKTDVVGVVGVGVGLDLGDLGPDGLSLDGPHDLSQLSSGDVLVGAGPILDATGDPFAQTS